MTSVSDELRERLKLKYMGDCKCGHCALVPDDLVVRAANELDALLAALRNLLNDCINFDGGKLTEVFQIEAARAIAKAEGPTP